MSDGHEGFHRQIAREMETRYAESAQAPEGWREIQIWHYERAGDYAWAVVGALALAEQHVTRTDFFHARQWVERALALIDRLPVEEQRAYQVQTYALALAVLEFGGQYREGLEYATRLLRAANEQHNGEAAARAHLAIGRMQRELGQLAAAEASFGQARDLAGRYELDELEIEIRLQLAKVHQLQGRHLEALQELQLAREEQEQRSDKFKLARVFTAIGDIYRVLGSSREAMNFYNRALTMEQHGGRTLGQAILYEKQALSFLAQRRTAEAAAAAEESLRLRERINDIVGMTRAYTVLGTVFAHSNEPARAFECYQRALALQEQTQNPRGQVIALLHLGDASRVLNQLDQAELYFNRALTLVRQDKDQIGIARALERLGDLQLQRGQREQARDTWNEALQIREALRHSDEVGALRERLNRLAL